MEVAVMLKQHVIRLTDEQGRRLETLTLRWGGNL
jgi:predicted DNA-binding protein